MATLARTAGKATFGSVGQTSGGSWWARYTHNAAMHRPGRTFATEKLAQGWLAIERRLIDLDQWTPPAERRALAEASERADSTTLDEYARGWIDKRVTRKGGPLHPRTREDYLKYLGGMLAPLAPKPISAITLADVKRWHNGAAKAPSQRHKAYAFLKSVMKSATIDGLIETNPCNVENATRRPRTRHNSAVVVKWLTHDRVTQLAGLVQPRDRLLILLAAYCCLRTGEAFALRRRDLELGTGPDGQPFGWLTVERGVSTYDGQRHEGETKTGELGNRVVPIPPHLVAEIRAHLDQWAEAGPDGLLFPSTNPAVAFRTASQVNGNAERPRKPGYGWYRARQLAGCPEAHLHDLRHWGATLWDEAGTPAGLRIAIMGHAQSGMTGHYTHPDTTKASPYAQRVSELAGWVSPNRSAGQDQLHNTELVGSALAAVLAALDDSALAAAITSLSAEQLAEVVPSLPTRRVAAVVTALAGGWRRE